VVDAPARKLPGLALPDAPPRSLSGTAVWDWTRAADPADHFRDRL